jgi:PadR family transcriptional regulator, regulatory protein PadR
MATAFCCASGKSPTMRCSLSRERSIPALFRLVRQGLLKASWGTSENNRRAKFYELTAAGRKRLREETDKLESPRHAMASALAAQPEEV